MTSPRFRALVVTKDDGGYACQPGVLSDADLMDGNVTVRISHSTINYKDGLAVTGKSPIIRKFPLIPGIDFSGIVETSDDNRYKPGDAVILTGWGVGESHSGGFAEKARLKGEWLVPLPPSLSAARAMAIGTAGFTAMQCVMALEKFGLTPAMGSVIVTGAAGGVGSVAVALLAKLGWHVVASTGRVEEAEYLMSLGAAQIIDRSELSTPARPLGKERWIAGIDSVGSHTLANVLAMTKENGAVAACGLAQGMDLPSSVAPFILRGVSLLGINSVTAKRVDRLEIWRRLAQDLDLTRLDSMTSIIGFNDIIPMAKQILDGKVRGRTVVDMTRA